MQAERQEPEKKISLDGMFDPFGHLDLIIEKKITVNF